jgi:hypothetical protein
MLVRPVQQSPLVGADFARALNGVRSHDGLLLSVTFYLLLLCDRTYSLISDSPCGYRPLPLRPLFKQSPILFLSTLSILSNPFCSIPLMSPHDPITALASSASISSVTQYSYQRRKDSRPRRAFSHCLSLTWEQERSAIPSFQLTLPVHCACA